MASASSSKSVEELWAYVTSPDGSAGDAEAQKSKEQAIVQLCEKLVEKGQAQPQAELLSQLRGFFASIPKAKTAKIVRNIIDSIAKVPGSTQLLVSVGVWHARMGRTFACFACSSVKERGANAMMCCMRSHVCVPVMPPSVCTRPSPSTGERVQGAGGVGQGGEARLPAPAH